MLNIIIFLHQLTMGNETCYESHGNAGSFIFIFVRLMFIYFFIFLMDGMWDCGIQLYNPFYIYNKEVSEKFVMNKFYFS